MDKDVSRDAKLFLIFLEHPGGLRRNEFLRIVEDRKICSKNTACKWLKDLEKSELKLIVRDKLKHFKLGSFSQKTYEALAYIYTSPERVGKFFGALFQAYENAGRKNPQNFALLGIAYIKKELYMIYNQMSFLFPYMFDNRIRQIWFEGVKYSVDLMAEKLDEMAKKLYGVGAAELFTAALLKGKLKKIYEERIEAIRREYEEAYEEMANLIDNLEIEDELKNKIKDLAFA